MTIIYRELKIESDVRRLRFLHVLCRRKLPFVKERVASFHTCCQLPQLLSVTPPVVSYPTCRQLPHLLPVPPPVANYPSCYQLPHLLSVTPPVVSYPTRCQLPHLLPFFPPVANFPTCCQLPHLLSVPAPFASSRTFCQLPVHFSDALDCAVTKLPQHPTLYFPRQLSHISSLHLQYTVTLLCSTLPTELAREQLSDIVHFKKKNQIL